jgi:hypothetical protein
MPAPRCGGSWRPRPGLMKGWTAALADTGNGSPDRKRQEPKGGSWLVVCLANSFVLAHH